MDLGSGEPGVPYMGDEHRVRQVLVNLLANAVKFTPSGGEVTVTCGAASEPEPGVWTGARPDTPPTDASAPEASAGWAFIRITDTGPGLEPELLGRLFEPFVQGDPALTREHGGTGLGLAISRRLARLMHGDIVARSQPGAGATFTLWLPGAIARAAERDASAARPDDVGEPAMPPGAGGRWIKRTPPGTPVIVDSDDGPLDAAAHDVLHALAVRLAAEAETVAERYVAALRADGRFPGARALTAVQLRDHATPLVGLLASQLMVVGETRGAAPELLGDGAQVHRVMSELHGAQRHRLGWSESDIDREIPYLLAETERALREALSTARPDDVSTLDAQGAEPSSEAARAALQYAVAATRQMLEQGSRTALRAYRFAKATANP
jgi:hypothetical protein